MSRPDIARSVRRWILVNVVVGYLTVRVGRRSDAEPVAVETRRTEVLEPVDVR